MSIVVPVAIAVAAAIALYWLFPDRTEQFFGAAWRAKGWMLTALGVAFVVAFLSTGNPLLVFIGMVGVALWVWYILYEADWEVSVNA